MKKRISIRLEGRVQGVGFRMYVKEWAEYLKLYGIVSNLDDGSVYIVIEGKEPKIVEFLQLLENDNLELVPDSSNWSKITVRLAKIDNVVYSWEDCRNEFEKFDIVREKSFNEDQYRAFRNFLNNIVK